MSMPSPPQLCFPQASSDGFLIPVAALTPDSLWPGTKSDHRSDCQLAAGGGWDGGGPAAGSSPKSQGPGRGGEGAGGASSSTSLRPRREATSAGWTPCRTEPSPGQRVPQGLGAPPRPGSESQTLHKASSPPSSWTYLSHFHRQHKRDFKYQTSLMSLFLGKGQ